MEKGKSENGKWKRKIKDQGWWMLRSEKKLRQKINGKKKWKRGEKEEKYNEM